MKKIVEIKNITKSFGGEVVLDNINLDIYDNEFITLLGPSGCGKTTLLRIIGGFETPDKGDVIFMGENINGLPPPWSSSTFMVLILEALPQANQMVPTGISFVPPVGPAIPVAETA